jgi:hypothetical protein
MVIKPSNTVNIFTRKFLMSKKIIKKNYVCKQVGSIPLPSWVEGVCYVVTKKINYKQKEKVE